MQLHKRSKDQTYDICHCSNVDPKLLPKRIAKKHQFYIDDSAFSTDPKRLVCEKSVVHVNIACESLGHTSYLASMPTLQSGPVPMHSV